MLEVTEKVADYMEGRSGKEMGRRIWLGWKKCTFSSPPLFPCSNTSNLLWNALLASIFVSPFSLINWGLKQQSHWVHCWVTAYAWPASTWPGTLPYLQSLVQTALCSLCNLPFLLTHFTGQANHWLFAGSELQTPVRWTLPVLSPPYWLTAHLSSSAFSYFSKM